MVLAQTEEIFEFSGAGTNRSLRSHVVEAVIMFLLAIVFLLLGDTWSLLEDPHRNTSSARHYGFNLVVGFVFTTFGFLALFSIKQRKSKSLSGLVISKETVKASDQGVRGQIVEISFSEIVKLQKLSIDGIWEFNIASHEKQIRVAKASLKVTDEFEKMIEHVQEQIPSCELEIKERIDPPLMSS